MPPTTAVRNLHTNGTKGAPPTTISSVTDPSTNSPAKNSSSGSNAICHWPPAPLTLRPPSVRPWNPPCTVSVGLVTLAPSTGAPTVTVRLLFTVAVCTFPGGSTASTCSLTFTAARPRLSVLSPSGVAAVISAVLVNTVPYDMPVLATPVMVITPLAPGGRSITSHVKVRPPVGVIVAPLLAQLTAVTTSGTRSLISTPLAGDGPLLAYCSV